MIRTLIIAGLAAFGLASASTADAHGLVVRPTLVVQPYPTFYRVNTWQERSFLSFRDAVYFQERLRLSGYQVYMVRHGYHFDVFYRLPCIY